MPERREPFMMQGVTLVFKNFEGRERPPFNELGERNFGVLIDPSFAEQMIADDYPVKFLKPREDDGDEDVPPQAWIKIKLNYDTGRKPKVVMITSQTGRRKNLDETEVGDLDYADIERVDLTVRPYWWEFGGKSGWTLYLQNMYITIIEDPLDALYSEQQKPVPEEVPQD